MQPKAISETYLAILESIGEGIIFVNSDDQIAYINQTAETIRGIKGKNFIGRSVQSIHAPALAERMQVLLQGLRDGSITRSRRVIEVRGSFFENTYYPVRQPDNTYLGILLVSRDITEKHQLQIENRFFS